MSSEPTTLTSSVAPYTASSDIRLHPLASSPASRFFPGNTLANPSLSSQANTSSNLNNSSPDDVTTIFVVGFPDDMTEREFQNMFTFSSGFEAGALKWHCKEQDDENAAAGNNNSSKKQMIGFARFRTRLEALEAVEVLNGKRVDQERGNVLKAEMAKKNLHIKRGSVAPSQHGTSANAATGDSISPPPLSFLSKKMQYVSQSAYDSFSPLPSDLLSPADYNKADPFMKDPFQNCSTASTPAFNDGLLGFRSQSFDSRQMDLGLMSPTRGFGLVPPPRMAKVVQENADSDPFNYLSKSSPVPNERGFKPSSSPSAPTTSSIFFSEQSSQCFASRFGPLSVQTANLTEFRTPSLSSPSYNTSTRSFNPADQNPPCNTLYVGNLPPNSSEEELRQLFSKCRGYRRMSFRTKPQGPMCFVEFEDVVYATQAMNELQGYYLSSSVKGGIRLSFSKNPLFTKPNKEAGTGGKAVDRKDLGVDNVH